MSRPFSESIVEEAALDLLAGIGWTTRNGADIAPDALDDAFRKLTRPEGADLVTRNRSMHRLFVDGVTVEYGAEEDGTDDLAADAKRGGRDAGRAVPAGSRSPST